MNVKDRIQYLLQKYDVKEQKSASNYLFTSKQTYLDDFDAAIA